MTQASPDNFTHAHVFGDDGVVTFRCSTDVGVWPWLALNPCDPIVVQTLNFYATYEVAIARGHYDQGQWTALTQTSWQCIEGAHGHAVRGIAYATEDDGPGYRMSFFDADDQLLYEMQGEGVVFRNRNFEAWRSEQKPASSEIVDAGSFIYAPCESLGLATQAESYLSSASCEGAQSATGLITTSNGFLPGHPYHSGSGDHVNASHLADVGRQFVRLLRGETQLRILRGEMAFKRYVELGLPFQIELVEDLVSKNAVVVRVHQAGRDCATLTLTYGSPRVPAM